MKKYILFCIFYFTLVSAFAADLKSSTDCAQNKPLCLKAALSLSIETLRNFESRLKEQSTLSLNFSKEDITEVFAIFVDPLKNPIWIYENHDVITKLKCGQSSAAYINDQSQRIYLCEDSFKNIETLSHNLIHEAYHLYQFKNLAESTQVSKYPGLGPSRIYLECVATEFATANMILNDMPILLSDYFFNQRCEPTVKNIHQLMDSKENSPRIETLLNQNLDLDFIITDIEPIISNKVDTMERASEMVTTEVTIKFNNGSKRVLQIENWGLPVYLKDLVNLL